MRLSDKGYEKLNKHACTLIDPIWVAELWKDGACEEELEQDDFVDGIVLTVAEASEVWDSLVNLVSYAESMEGSLSDLVRDGQRNIDLIRNRIKKAEGK